MAAPVTLRGRAGNVVVLFAAIVALCGAAADPDAAVRAAHVQDVRLLAIGDRLARGCVGLDGDATVTQLSLPGVLVQDVAQYGTADRAAAARVLHLGEGPTVAAILPGSNAARASLAVGDRIVEAGGVAMTASAARDPYARMAQFEAVVAGAIGSLRLSVRRRDGSRFETTIAPQPGCAGLFQIVPGGLLRTKADGRYIQISQAMVDAAPSDDALAAVTAHELAHTTLRHAARKMPSKQAENEADWLSIWLLARAGYDIDAAIPFWTLLGKRTDLGILSDTSHPSWKKRVARMAEAVALVKAQREAGQDLVPPPQQSTSQAEIRR